MLDAGLRLPQSNGRVSVRIGNENFELTGKNLELFLRYRGDKFTELLFQNETEILTLAGRIQDGEEDLRDELNRILQRLHRQANDFGKDMMAEEL